MTALLAAVRGAAAGAAGTTALNAATYLDMVVRGRPASRTPQDTVTTLADRTGMTIPGDAEVRANRIEGLAPLLGAAAGVGAGAALGLVHIAARPGRAATVAAAAAAAMVVGNGPMTLLGVTDPRTWAASDWAADVLPHLAYAVVAGFLLDALASD